MYAIFNVIYGVPLTEKVYKKICELEADETSNWNEDDNKTCGFNTYYSGSSDVTPGFCGVELSDFDEGSDGIKLSSLDLVPTEEQKEQAHKDIEQLIKDFPQFKDLIEEPAVWLIPSTS